MNIKLPLQHSLPICYLLYYTAHQKEIRCFRKKALQNLNESIMNEPEYQLPEPPAMMSARTYKAKFVDPLIARFKSLISTLFARYFKALDSYHRLNITNGNLYRENENLSKVNEKLSRENENLRAEDRDYKLLRKVFGHKQIDDLLEKARNIKGQKREKHTLKINKFLGGKQNGKDNF